MTRDSFEAIIAFEELMLPEHSSRTKPSSRWSLLLAVAGAAAILVLILAPPHGLLDKVDRAACAVCHRIPERTFTAAGRPLPLCARCSGTYLGAVAGLAVLSLRGRGRAGELPAPKYLAVLGFFLAVWAVDGFNSFLTFFPGIPHLYKPNNLLRLATGILEGLAIAAVLLPAFNRTLWAHPQSVPSVGSWPDLGWLLAAGVCVWALVGGGAPFLLYPLVILSGLAVLILLGVVNTMFALIVLRWDGQIDSWKAAAPLLLVGMGMAAIELAAVSQARLVLESWLRGLP